MNKLFLGVAIGAAMVLVGCSGGSSDGTNVSDGSNASLGGSSSTASIEGLWDFTQIDPEFGEDIYYVDIFSDGTTTIYDYQQDQFDGGDNCYLIIDDQTLTPIGGNQYRSDTAGFPSDTEILTITRSGNLLTVSGIDMSDQNGNGNATETLSSTFPLLTGVDPAFNECT